MDHYTVNTGFGNVLFWLGRLQKNGKPEDTFESDPHDALRYMIDNLETHLVDDESEEEPPFELKFNQAGLPIEG